MIYLQKWSAPFAFIGNFVFVLFCGTHLYAQSLFGDQNCPGAEHAFRPIGLMPSPVPAPRAPIDSLRNPFVPAFGVGNFNFAAAEVGANYSFRSNYSGYGFGGGLLSSPCPGRSQFEFDAGFHHYSYDYSYTYLTMTHNYTEDHGIVDLNAIYFWNCCDFRYGPAGGYHLDNLSYTDATVSNSYHIFNVGGYGQYVPHDNHFTGSAKAGYAFGDDKGFYAGVDLGYYFCDEFDLCGGFDYTGYNSWKVVSFRGDYQISKTVPVAVSAGYNISSYANSNTFSLGLKYQWNVPTSITLEDREHTGVLTGYQVRY